VRYKSDILFAFDKAELGSSSLAVLKDLADALQGDENLKSVLMVGHTDAMGSNTYNQNLSRRRAIAVFGALADKGISKMLLGVVPMGEIAPVATNTTAEGRALNRRVEFFISDLPQASIKAVEMAGYDPCFRNDQELGAGQSCDRSVQRISVFLGNDGRGRASLTINLGSGTRPALPNERLTRPSLNQYFPIN
jgi:OmpA family